MNTFEYNIEPQENLPTVSRKAVVSNIQIDLVNKRLAISILTKLVDIFGEAVGSPNYIGTKSLYDGYDSSNISEELQELIDFEISAIENLSSVSLNTAITNILKYNNINII